MAQNLALRSAIVGPDLIDKFIHSLLRNREAQVFDDLAKVKSMWRESLYVRQMLPKKTSTENSEKKNTVSQWLKELEYVFNLKTLLQ